MVTLKEKSPASTGSLPIEFVSPRAVFDAHKAGMAKTAAEGYLLSYGISELAALRDAVALAFYNSGSQPVTDEGIAARDRMMYAKLPRLIQTELACRNSSLPTIGIEVESPKLPFLQEFEKNTRDYGQVFDNLGMPRNRANVKTANKPAYWEFAPLPSNSAAVQERIIAELVNGGFLPHIKRTGRPAYPPAIQKYLDPNLVSLHVNLGIPPVITEEYHDNTDICYDVSLMVGALVLSYTSALRLASKKSSEIFLTKDGVHIDAGLKSKPPKRLEIKGFEVNDLRTYRLLRNAQLLAAALFADMGEYNHELGAEWVDAREKFITVFNRHDLDTSYFFSKDETAEAATRPGVSRDIRSVVEEACKRIARVIGQRQSKIPPAVDGFF